MTAWCAHMIQRYSAGGAHALDANPDLKLLPHIMRRMSHAHIVSTLSAPGLPWQEQHAAH